MSELTISEAAEFLGVSARTLRYWDSIGLLCPTWRTMSDYRLYTDDDLARGVKILVYRTTGMSLREIAGVLDDPAQEREVLSRQRQRLVDEQAHLQRMVRAVDKLLEDTVNARDMVEEFGGCWQQYADEAESRFGDTPEWQQSQQRVAAMGAGDWDSAQRLHEQFVAALQRAQKECVQPGSDAARDLVAMHRAYVEMFYDCSLSKQVCLARMYVADERFARSFQGTAPYLLTLVEAQAESAGLDLSAIEWS
ncbi:MerR family transcriptional regulator [Corynebacterium aquilae]|uniref:HTH merR-type domain-containing protein n=1 Tax=Corynebacterium aquilae DSM 44791 TaxID=1431546 RepID=A0A1L7CDU9_9CORY|nr:MerR family transcriptional regulator [Corynebacterium aquilae]APT84015.1 hypothetical protein CAQU_01825 [Corynebacterium aquilae DSM 44791]